jgi:hypothetical protein
MTDLSDHGRGLEPAPNAAGENAIRAPSRDRITIVLIFSIAYSGSTWLTLVAGSHPDAFCLGAGDRILDWGPTAAENLCVVHGRKCRFWPGFFERYDPAANFFVELARYTGKRVFAVNNAPQSMIDRHMRHPDIDLKVVKLVRDGRAALASAMRHNPERVDSVYQAAIAWLYRGTLAMERRAAQFGQGALLIRLEDAVDDAPAMLRNLARHTGVDYDQSSLRFWEFEHHLATGNRGTLDLLIRLQGGSGYVAESEAYYRDLLDHLKRTNGIPKLDLSWRQAYDEVDLAACDFAAGALYQKYGYETARVSEETAAACKARYHHPPTLEEAERSIGPWRRAANGPEPAAPQSTAWKLASKVAHRLPLRLYQPLIRVYRRAAQMRRKAGPPA